MRFFNPFIFFPLVGGAWFFFCDNCYSDVLDLLNMLPGIIDKLLNPSPELSAKINALLDQNGPLRQAGDKMLMKAMEFIKELTSTANH